MPEAPRIKHITDITPIPAAGVGYRFVRRELGITAFGINAFTANAGEQLIEEHDETGAGAGRHEELYMVIAGHARFTIDGSEHDAPAGTLVFLPDPESHRMAIALADGTTAVAVGGTPGQAYRVSPWEAAFAAKPLADAGDPGAAADQMAMEMANYPGSSHMLYNTACFEALAGRRDDAIAHLREAVEITPEMRDWAAKDEDFDSIRDDPEFPR
ncbi:MAG TPA: AraC family ligand binding domain-containing protein [Solirubrobacteraceae bacterium]|nr:AraC family ligand binding domain-containing protein [Solirubrobacteraceae bacterium]